jgi:hypothetical protein
MNPAKRAITLSLKFVSDHRTPIAVVTTAVVTAVVVNRILGKKLESAYDFIDENGLTHEFVESVAPFTVDVS